MPSDQKPAGRDSRDLFEQSRAGSLEALGCLLERHLPGLRAFVRLRLGPGLRALESESDLVQSVCADLLGHVEGFEYRGEAQFRQWLFTAVLNKIRNKHRHYMSRKPQPPGSRARELDAALLGCYATITSPSNHAIRREQVDRLEQAFDRLPERYREVLTLAQIVGLSQKETAEEMGRTVPSVRNLQNRALVKLAAELAALQDEGRDAASDG